jgi:hypothetical protein
MKTRVLWALILSVGSTALYFGIVRPDAPADPKRIQDLLDQDPATQPPVQLPPLEVSESRLPAATADEQSSHGQDAGEAEPRERRGP